MTAPDAALSVSGKRWTLSPVDERRAQALAQQFDLPPAAARILAARGVTPEQADAFLNPSLKHQLPDPDHLRDMDRAAARLEQALRNGERLAIFGDYDVDGATSTAVLGRFFRLVGADFDFYTPDRLREGYGPNLPALLKLQQQGARLVLTVDCGVTAFEALAGAARAGLDVIVIDHHAAEARLPEAVAIVNPNRLDDDSPHKHLAAVGVAFLLLVSLNRRLRESGWYQAAGRPEPDLRLLLDLVALGTVCDVASLHGVNRVLVAQGLKVMRRRRNIGLAALADVAKLDQAPEAGHLGFALGPRINAGGRVGDSSLGARLLLCDDAAEASTLAQRLDALNEERRAIEAACLAEAVDQVERSNQPDSVLICPAATGWHPGVIGVVASRLKERYQRPSCVIAFDDDGIGKGSGRSIEGVDLGAAVLGARQAGLLVNGGGHRMAAGFTVTRDRYPEYVAYLTRHIENQITAETMTPRLMLDGVLTPDAITPDFLETLKRLAPFGVGNPTPRFLLDGVRIADAGTVGGAHVRCRLARVGDQGPRFLQAIAFRCADQDLGRFLLTAGQGPPVRLAGRAALDRWRGRETLRFQIDDAASIPL